MGHSRRIKTEEKTEVVLLFGGTGFILFLVALPKEVKNSSKRGRIGYHLARLLSTWCLKCILNKFFLQKKRIQHGVDAYRQCTCIFSQCLITVPRPSKGLNQEVKLSQVQLGGVGGVKKGTGVCGGMLTIVSTA